MGIDMHPIDRVLEACDAAVEREQRWTRLAADIRAEREEALDAGPLASEAGAADAFEWVLRRMGVWGEVEGEA